jgi:IS5 family transposase
MLERHIARQDTVPRQTASDGGYASIANLEQAKALGVHDVVFHKKRGMAIEDMAKRRHGQEKTWPRADGYIASFETFVPVSKQTYHA